MGRILVAIIESVERPRCVLTCGVVVRDLLDSRDRFATCLSMLIPSVEEV